MQSVRKWVPAFAGMTKVENNEWPRLKELKGRINSVKSTQKITKAKQMVAAAKLRKAQAAAEAARPYATRLAAVMASLAGKVAVSDSSPKLLSGTGKDQIHLLVVANLGQGPVPARSIRTSCAPRWPRLKAQARPKARPCCSTLSAARAARR